MGAEFDFSGWATRNDIKCSDGRTIRSGAFQECDGLVVPLVWNHDHKGAENVLGHALLECRNDGVYTYGKFNDTENGKLGKSLVMNGDITALSIYANGLKQRGGDVIHGAIREVSLVLAGANPGAYIDTIIAHSDDYDEEAEICFVSSDDDDYTSLEHTVITPDEDVKPEEKPAKKKTKKTKTTTNEEDEEMAHSAEGKTVSEVFETFTEDQKAAMYAIIHEILNGDSGEGDDDMKHNVFEADNEENSLSHSDIEAIFNEAKRNGSLREAFLAHGIDDIEYLYPEDHNLNNPPEFIARDQGWVSTVMSGVHHTPFMRIKSQFANITEADARAKGYMKGNRKTEEVFGLLKRSTDGTTVYKKQKLDRDDIIDITDFDVVAWLKGEMRMMLNEELARAYLIGDGRNPLSEDKINEQNIRPIWTDDDLFTVKKVVPVAATATASAKADAFIDTVLRSRKDYKGSGNPTMFMAEDMLSDMLLIKDLNGHRIYKSEAELATAMRVRNIVTVPVFEGLSRTVNGATRNLMGIMVNLSDYNVGTNKGGEVNMFDDFDIDFNQYKYLMETRCSGALTKPFSAVVFEMVYEVGFTVDPEDQSTTILGKSVGDLQSGVIVNDDFISGTLKYVTNYTGYSSDVEKQKGNFLALKFNTVDSATTTLQLLGSENPDRIVTLDADMNAVIRVTDKSKEKLKVVSTLDGVSVTKIYSLSSLKLINA